MKTSMFLGLGLLTGGAAGETPTPAAATAPYMLFMGADFALQNGGGYYRVLNVVGSSFVIREGGRFVHIHSGALPISIRVKRSLKLMPGSATLGGFSWERDYMAGTNPEEKAAAAFTNLLGYEQQQMDSAAQMGVAGSAPVPMTANGVVPNGMTANTPGYVAPGSPPLLLTQMQPLTQARSQALMNSAQQTLGEDTLSTNAYNRSQQDAAAADGRNALHIKFNLQSPLALRKPYAMFVALIHAPGHKHQKQQWIGGTEVDSVEAGRPVHVDFFQGGFPPGFQVDKLSVYIYDDGGRELGTNLSNDRVGLTREQAFQYLVIEYLGDHRHSTLPATPAMTKLPADWRAHLGEAAFRQTYFVRVDTSGHSQGIFTDPDCRQPADAYLSEMIRGVWFRPALHEGQPVETVTQVVPEALAQ